MSSVKDELGYLIMRFIAPRSNGYQDEMPENYLADKLEQFFGGEVFSLIKDKVVVDFGCGAGIQSVEMAQKGAKKVIGIDIQEHLLQRARQRASQFGVEDRCFFTKKTDELADIVISKDAFEHFSNPSQVLDLMSRLIKPDGYVLAAFGPTWLHPYGGHLFSVFPWSHIIFTENSLIRWRSNFKNDGATKFSEVAGGLNQLTIKKFEQIVMDSPFCFEWLETVPIKNIHFFKLNFFREFGSSIVRCKLQLDNSGR